MIKLTEHKAAYAYKNDQLVHIANVSRGLKCGCLCAACGGRLIARKGQSRIHHFAHAADTDCLGSAETVLHLLAKELISKMASMLLPEYILKKERKLKSGMVVRHEQNVVKGGNAVISKVLIEQAENRFIPDITLESNSKILFVEIAVTHKVDRAKLRHIRKLGIAAIEIFLDIEDATLTREELSIKLQTDIDSKQWLFHPKQKLGEREFIDKVRFSMRNARKLASNRKINISATPLNPQSSYQYPRPSPNRIRSEGLSIAQLDRMRYEFFLRFRRQPNFEEELKLESILYGNKTNARSKESYASVKGKRRDGD